MAKKGTAKGGDWKDELVKEILTECERKVRQNLPTKTISRDAYDTWSSRFERGIRKRLAHANEMDAREFWRLTRPNVLRAAKQVGVIATALDKEAGSVKEWVANAALDAVKQDPKCQSRSRRAGKAGILGDWCESA